MTIRFPIVTTAAGWISACSYFSNPGAPPAMTPVELPAQQNLYTATTAPVPAKKQNTHSLWPSGAHSFFRDQRAHQIGDILTVTIDISDNAQLDNTTSRSRNNSEDIGLQALFGIEKKIPGADPAFGMDSATAMQGSGAVKRAETVNLTIAAEVVQKLHNDNLLIAGRQEVRINNEIRELLVSGIIQPSDVSPDNTIAHTQIAQARISYGGRGDLSLVQRPRYGFRAWNKFSPF